MITVNFLRTDNDKVCVEVEEGTTLMQAAKKADIREIPADCGGNCACATCHIYLTNAWAHLLPIKQNGSFDFFITLLCNMKKHFGTNL